MLFIIELKPVVPGHKGKGNCTCPVQFAIIFLFFLISENALSNSGVEPGKAFNNEQALAFSQSVINRTLNSYRFVNRDNKLIDSSNYRGKPLLISFIYTSCYHTCPVLTKSLGNAVKIARQVLGKDSFYVATIGFDTGTDTPERMNYFAGEQGIEDEYWHFLSAGSETIAAISRELGFIFFPSPKGFDHLAQVTVIDSNGKVYRQIYGNTFDPPQIVEPLKELIFGTSGYHPVNLADWINNIKLFCTIYDPSTGRYRFDYSIFIAIITGVLCLLAILFFIFHARRVNKQRQGT